MSKFLTHLASKFSTKVKKQRITNSNPKFLRQSFDILGPLIKKNSIQPYNAQEQSEWVFPTEKARAHDASVTLIINGIPYLLAKKIPW